MPRELRRPGPVARTSASPGSGLGPMHRENIVFDAVDPQRLGRFWQELLGCEQLTDTPEGFGTRLSVPGGPTLDLCFQPVPEPPRDPLGLHLDIGQGDVPWVVPGRSGIQRILRDGGPNRIPRHRAPRRPSPGQRRSPGGCRIPGLADRVDRAGG
ncbi:VOC family protein [Arthrobacter sp. AQ5-05]|uniref:VOC family protein n=1 Tax=Arthrobacter sp. AQ5-05 TaxID=2184581 RepID=UPI00336A81B2